MKKSSFVTINQINLSTKCTQKPVILEFKKTKFDDLREGFEKKSKGNEESVKGLYKGIENLTQFLNDIQYG